MMDLERLDEAIGWGELSLAEYRDEIGDEAAPTIRTLLDAARAYRNLLANGERVEPDYEAAAKTLFEDTYKMHVWEGQTDSLQEWWRDRARLTVDAAVGGRLLVDPPKEEGYQADHPYEPKGRFGGLCCEFRKSAHPPKEETT